MKHALIAAVLAVIPMAAPAAVIDWSAVLAPGNEVPPVVGSNGSGSATGTLDTVSGLLEWMVVWTDLSGPALGAHFHGPATPAQNAAVQVNFGLISGLTSPSIGSTTISDVQMAQLRAGLWYVNVHTAVFPAGEIRGQVVPGQVPVPAALPLLLTAGLALGGLAARRR